MRHVNMISRAYAEPGNKPCQIAYTFKNPTPNRRYVQILKFVDAHPGCKRIDILKGVFKTTRRTCPTTFSQMLYADILDYNSKFEYKVTRKGKNILKKVAKMG